MDEEKPHTDVTPADMQSDAGRPASGDGAASPAPRPHWVQVLLLTLGELAFAVVAVPLYVAFVLPKYPEGALPGFVPVIAEGVNPLLAVLAALGVLAVSIAAVVVLPRLLGGRHFKTEAVDLLVEEYSELDLVPVFVAAGFAEEFLFRVVLVDWCGLLLASLLFTVVHLAYWRKPLLMLALFGLALLLGALYLFTGSLLLCATVHAIYNLLIPPLMKRGIINLDE